MYIEDKVFSVLMTEEEYTLYSEFLEEREYTKYDETDQIKRMKDSDILASKKRSNTGHYVSAAGSAGLGAGIGAAAGAILSKTKWGKGLKTSRATKVGAGLGALVGGGASLAASSDKRSKNNFYNNRLEYAQRHAQRRESSDWSNNNLNREGYTY